MRWHDAPPVILTVDGDRIASWPLRFCGIMHPEVRQTSTEPGYPPGFEVYSIETSYDGEHWLSLPDALLTEELYEALARIGVDAETGAQERERSERQPMRGGE
ncbi:hypothetical protein [Azospirillum thermophilum]|uniref:Uncharacterized protein n=1 Tax=Azospirillum thermophilum TaxID=2202148 RepID=A0A2S2CKL8_9PROT|nr:hypothetical protein [Azospirillum thermophilum]AWK85058.1 hypothetical protein DEW08_01640 [Azospirillum thermophilum]